MERLEFTVSAEEENTRIDVYLADRLDGLTRSYVQKLIGEGHALAADKAVKANYKVRAGDVIEVMVPEPTELSIQPENIPLDILYEDDDLIVLYKPKGMVVHPAAGHYSGTVVNALLYHCGGNLSGINGVLRPGIVHRIDMDTSGVIVAAKNDLAHQSLSLQFQDHSIHRRYQALLFGNLKEDAITVDRPIGRHPVDRKRMAVNEKNGKRAVTHLKVLERFQKYTFAEASLETGRTHQIRVHAASIGHPIVGDQVYGREKQPFKTQGQMLHAGLLGFIHPARQIYMEFTADLPAYFADILHKIG